MPCILGKMYKLGLFMFGMSERLKLHSHAEIDICTEWEKNCKGRIDETFTAQSHFQST
jgi:hypothetical protein